MKMMNPIQSPLLHVDSTGSPGLRYFKLNTVRSRVVVLVMIQKSIGND